MKKPTTPGKELAKEFKRYFERIKSQIPGTSLRCEIYSFSHTLHVSLRRGSKILEGATSSLYWLIGKDLQALATSTAKILCDNYKEKNLGIKLKKNDKNRNGN